MTKRPTKPNGILPHSFLSEAEAHQPVASPLDLVEAVMGCFAVCGLLGNSSCRMIPWNLTISVNSAGLTPLAVFLLYIRVRTVVRDVSPLGLQWHSVLVP